MQIATTPSANSLHLPLEIESTDNAVKLSVQGLVDCGATSEFIDRDYALSNNIPTRRLTRAVPVYNVDGTPNEAGSISEVAEMVVTYKGHSERVQFAVTGLGKQKLILGFTWLKKHNPEINWTTGEVKMTRCLEHHCAGCIAERRHQRTVARILAQLRSSYHTVSAIDLESTESSELESEEDGDEDDPALEAVDCIFYTRFTPSNAEHLRATTTVSQHLAEAFARNSAPKGDGVPA